MSCPPKDLLPPHFSSDVLPDRLLLMPRHGQSIDARSYATKQAKEGKNKEMGVAVVARRTQEGRKQQNLNELVAVFECQLSASVFV